MSHRIALEEARKKFEKEKEIQQLIKEGKTYKSNRYEKKKQKREFKLLSFIGLLKDRGGYGPDNEKKKKEKSNGNS